MVQGLRPRVGLVVGSILLASTVAVGQFKLQSAQPQPRQVYYPYPPIADGSFETPDLVSGFCYSWDTTCTPPISQSPWTFSGGAGVATNGSGFTSQNPDAPHGDQVLFMQGGNSVARQGISVPGRHYRITLMAAQRIHGGVNEQLVSVRVDGVEVDQIAPTDGGYTLFTTRSFWLDAGSHEIELAGLNPETGDNTLLIDDLQLISLGSTGSDNWTDPGAWPNGVLPDESTEVVIQDKEIVILNTNTTVKSLTVHGELHCAPGQTISLTTDFIKIAPGGSFECGSEQSPFLGDLTIELVAGLSDPMMGIKFLGVASGGTLELHGEPRTSWTQLSATAGPLDLALNVIDDVSSWRSGDQIVIAPTNANYYEGEIVIVESVQGGGQNVTLQAPPQYTHYGETTDYDNGTWTLDERAEVGLLTRNITIQGDDLSANGVGGHTMVHNGAFARVSGVEFHRMGQNDALGRYPFHWHLAGDVSGQYLKNSSIHEAYHRCVTVHGTNYALVADNVCYDFVGHGYFLEDGNEVRNVFDHNLAILAKKPVPAAPPFLESDSRNATASNGPGAFWITHLDNDFTNNVAAGSEGTGFWFNQTNQGELQPLGVFDNNRAHSSRQGLSTCFLGGGPTGINPSNTPVLTNVTVNHTGQGLWPCVVGQTQMTTTFRRSIVANTLNGMQAPNPVKFEDALFVAYSANPLTPPQADLDWHGVRNYDQGYHFENARFVNYDKPAMMGILPGSGAHKHSSNRLEGVVLENSPYLFRDPSDKSKAGGKPAEWGDVLHDLDGSFVGENWAIVPDHSLMYDDSCVQPENMTIDGYACPYRYAHFRSEEGFAGSPVVATVIRSDGYKNTAEHISNRYITEFILDSKYLHSWRYEEGITRKKLQVHFRNAKSGDTVVYELLDVPANPLVPGWTQANDLPDLISGASGRYFWRDHSLFLKLEASGADWHATEVVDVCVTGDCNVNPAPFTTPSGLIRMPLDGARYASGQNIAVSAFLNDPDGIASARIYLGTDQVPVIPVVAGNWWSWTIPAPADGAYAFKMVIEDGAGTTFTELQQLFVGEPVPRVEITSIEELQTFDTATPLSIAYDLHNWPLGGAAGNHLRLYVNNEDMLGDITTAGPVSINLTQGKQDIKLALAHGSGSGHVVKAVHDVKRVYGMTNHVIADFEDGVDSRASLVGTDLGVTEIKFAWNSADPVASRADGVDDVNYYDAIADGGVSGTAVFRLELDPAQDWTASGMGRVQIEENFGSMPWTLWVDDGTDGLAWVGDRQGTTSTFNFPASIFVDEVIAIELHYDEANLPAPPARQHLGHIALVP